MKVFTFLCVLFSLSLTGISQQKVTEIKNLEWSIIPSQLNENNPSFFYYSREPFKQSVGDVEASKIYIDPNEAIVLVAYRKDEYGVIRVNSDGKVKWSTAIQGIPMKISLFGDKVIVITNADFKTFGGFSKEYGIVEIDPSSGKLLTSKSLYKRTDDEYIKLLGSKNGNFFYVGIRHDSGKKGATQDFSLLSLNDKLQLSVPVTFKIDPSSAFRDCVADSKGNVYISSFNEEDAMQVYCFSSSGEKKGMMLLPFNRKSKSIFNSRLFATDKAENVYASLEYKNADKVEALELYQLDFTNNKKKSSSTVVTKEFIKQKKEEIKAAGNATEKPNTGDWDNLRVTAILENGDKVLVLREAHASYMNYIPNSAMSRSDEWTTSDAFLSVYSKDLKELTTVVIPKYMSLNFPMGYGSSIHIKNNKLYFISAQLKPTTAILGTLSLTTLAFKIETLPKQDISKADFAEPKATLWFDKNFLVDYIDPKNGITIKKINTSLQKIEYE
jgi:hypothetical protein